MQRLDLKDLSLREMEALISPIGEKPYRAKQVRMFFLPCFFYLVFDTTKIYTDFGVTNG